MKKLIYIFIFNCLLLIANGYAQPSVTWQRLYDGPDHLYDAAYDICPADSGTFFVAGYRGFNNIPHRRIFVMKINRNSDTLWTNSILLNGDAGIALAIASSGDGGCVITGDVIGEKWVIKLDGNGNIQWQKTYGDTDYVMCNDIKRTPDNDYIICGEPAPGYNYNFFKIDNNGNIVWQKMFPYTSLNACDISNDGGYISVGNYIADGLIIKFNTNGDTLWTRKFSFYGNLINEVRSINSYPGGYLVGGSGTMSNGIVAGCFTKFDYYGNRLSTKLYTGSKDEFLSASYIINPGKYVFAFYHQESNIHDSEFNRLLITDSSGNIIHQKYIYNHNYQRLLAIQPDVNGDIIFVGQSDINESQTYRDIYIVRTDSMLNFPRNFISVKKINNIIPSVIKLYQNYPNPFNPNTSIKFDVPYTSNVNICIYDVLGNIVHNIVDNTFKPGTYIINFHLEANSSGVYFLRLKTECCNLTKKLVFIK